MTTSRVPRIPERIRWTVERLDLAPTDHVLEIGCGPGHAVGLVAERLTTGTRITISGWAAKDPQARAFSGNTVTFADGTTMVFGSTVPGASDGWTCSDDPCPYKYPDVGAK